MQRHSVRNNKRGSILIFLSFILVSMIGAALTFVISARETAEESYQRVMTDLACRSVLSEYDIRLKNDYGIFAFRGSGNYVEDRVSYYLAYTERNSKTTFSLRQNEITAEVKGFEIINVDLFEEQIVTAAKYNFFNPGNYLPEAEEDSSETTESIQGADKNSNTLNRESLPSYGYSDKGLKLDFPDLTAGGLRGLAAKAGNTFLANSYAFSVFNCYAEKQPGRDTYFEYEVEYLIGGKESDISNLAKVKSYFVILRTPVNIAKIYADPARSAAALAEAEALTPGPAATATQLLIITAWAVEDAEKDWQEVLAGGKVDGLGYKDYLAVFLTLQDRELKLLRMMDLIQINLRQTYYSSFLLKEYSTGFNLDITLDGRNLTYEHTY